MQDAQLNHLEAQVKRLTGEVNALTFALGLTIVLASEPEKVQAILKEVEEKVYGEAPQDPKDPDFYLPSGYRATLELVARAVDLKDAWAGGAQAYQNLLNFAAEEYFSPYIRPKSFPARRPTVLPEVPGSD